MACSAGGAPRHDLLGAPFEFELTHPKWCSMLVSQVLRGRCPFSSFVASSLKVPRSSSVSSLPMFPIPVPPGTHFDGMTPNISWRMRKRIHLDRVVHVLVMALNFLHFDGRFIGQDLLGRPPSPWHIRVYRQLRRFVLADASMPGFKVAKAGRRFPQLVARLSELSSNVTDLGLAGAPYSRSFQGREVKVNNNAAPELEPYRSLNAERLKLSGLGSWDPTEFLDDYLVMAYKEPDSLLISPPRLPGRGEAPILNDSVSEVAKLAGVWDKLGLLELHRFDVPDSQLVKVFNVYKNETTDRQIGDRRGRNYQECQICGPSAFLPSGVDFLDLEVSPARQVLGLHCSDRKDYYHQLMTTSSRCLSNTVGPFVAEDNVKDLVAYAKLVNRKSKVPYNRVKQGDFLGGRASLHPALPPGVLAVAFKSVLQGDHAGVEFATSAHENLLKSYGVLDESSRLLSSRHSFRKDLMQGLVIDDFFVVGVRDETVKASDCESWALHEEACRAYDHHCLAGSPEKDLWGEPSGKIIGAFLDSSSETRKQNLVTLSAPREKRYGLSWISLQLCQLPSTSDTLHLCLLGGWVWALLYRRPLMSVLQHSFNLVNNDKVSEADPKMLHLPRKVANELMLLAVLAPLMSSNLGASFFDKIFATDSSKDVGAVVSCRVGSDISRTLFNGCKTKGAYTRLDSLSKVLGRELGDEEVFEEPAQERVSRPLAYVFDFVEIFAGSAKVSRYVEHAGLSVCMPIELSLSKEFDMTDSAVMRWLAYLITSGLIRGFMIEPPCTTFSVMRRPALRNADFPYGFDPQEAKTKVGNELGFRGFQTMELGSSYGVPGILETPNSSKLKNFESWKRLAAKDNVETVRTDSCRFGSVHLKPFKFMVVEADPTALCKRCCCTGKHVKIEGSLTRESAIYTDELAKTLAGVLVAAIQRRKDAEAELYDGAEKGLESVLVNEVAASNDWALEKVWSFRKLSHINLQELAAVQKVAYMVAGERSSVRLVNFVDSNVVRCAVAKGRSSSRAIGAMLRRFCATLLAGDLYFTTPYLPTRLNPADDPTREKSIRQALPGLGLDDWEPEEVYALSRLSLRRRWAANWTILVLKLIGKECLHFQHSSAFRFRISTYFPAHSNPSHPMDFDATLGYPGEGPCLLGFRSCSHSGGSTTRSALFALSLVMSVCPCSRLVVCAMPVFPRNTADNIRAAQRRAVPLETGRQVLPVTSNQRQILMTTFQNWLANEGIEWEPMLKESHRFLDEINAILIRYGRCLYEAGRPYNHFAETINAVTSSKPSLRRSLQSTWNLAFGWLHNEPSAHHIAMPAQVLLCLLSISLMWGWTRIAGCLALGFGGLCRAGEIISATRRLLLLPADLHYTTHYALLSIIEPKTRFNSAKHQVAKIDQPDMLEILHMAFSRLDKHQKLWPYSGQTLRARFKILLKAAKLDGAKSIHGKLLDLGSLRAGGATWMIGATENPELTRRRGRWLNTRTLEIYVQEVAAAVFLSDIDPGIRDHVMHLASVFPKILTCSRSLFNAGVDEQAWPFSFCPAGRVQKDYAG